MAGIAVLLSSPQRPQLIAFLKMWWQYDSRNVRRKKQVWAPSTIAYLFMDNLELKKRLNCFF
jgi:hypothetical protein